jgi:hypothetical protein
VNKSPFVTTEQITLRHNCTNHPSSQLYKSPFVTTEQITLRHNCTNHPSSQLYNSPFVTTEQITLRHNCTNYPSSQLYKSPFCTHLIRKRPRHMTLKIQDLTWDRHKNVAGINRLIESQSSPLDNWISNGSTYINKR